MNKKQLALSFGLGIVFGYFVKQRTEMFRKMTPERALKEAKAILKQSGTINGSWIYMKPEEHEKDGLLYNVYRGGITRLEDGENKQYEFLVDIDTGTVIDSMEITETPSEQS